MFGQRATVLNREAVLGEQGGAGGAAMKKGLPAPPPTGVGEGSGKEGREEAEGQSKN